MVIYQQVTNFNIYLSKPLFINDLQKMSTVLKKEVSEKIGGLCAFTQRSILIFDVEEVLTEVERRWVRYRPHPFSSLSL